MVDGKIKYKKPWEQYEIERKQIKLRVTVSYSQDWIWPDTVDRQLSKQIFCLEQSKRQKLFIETFVERHN